MKKITINTRSKRMLADVYTPVGIYLRLRDKFRDTILLESTDHHSSENSYSFICINAIGGMEVSSKETIEFKYPGRNPEKASLKDTAEVPGLLWNYMQQFDVRKPEQKESAFAQGLFGYSTYDAVQFFDSIKFSEKKEGLTTPHSADAVPALPVCDRDQSFQG
jgi:anthranilate synthase component I